MRSLLSKLLLAHILVLIIAFGLLTLLLQRILQPYYETQLIGKQLISRGQNLAQKITPLIKQGKPYVTGLEGLESDGLIVSDLFGGPNQDAAVEQLIKRKWRYFIDGIEDAAVIAEIGYANWLAS